MAKIKRTMQVCPVRVACDGGEMTSNSEMCAACRKKMAQRSRKAAAGKIEKVM